MKLRTMIATGLIALTTLTGAALANQTIVGPPRVWVWEQYVPTPNQFGQPSIIYGLDNYPTLKECKAAIKAQPPLGTLHFDYCAAFNKYEDDQSGSGN